LTSVFLRGNVWICTCAVCIILAIAAFKPSILDVCILFSLGLGPDFGSPQGQFMRKKLVNVLSEFGKTSSFIDDVSIVKRYASGMCHALPVSSDDEALSKASKEVLDKCLYYYLSRLCNCYLDL